MILLENEENLIHSDVNCIYRKDIQRTVKSKLKVAFLVELGFIDIKVLYSNQN